MGSSAQRPLSELSPMAQRRNSPSWNQTTKMTLASSPFDSSPHTSHSPRLFWQGRDSTSSFQSLTSENTKPYDPDASFSPSKRASIENLKRASRVKNSNIFTREQNNEYDPAHVHVPDRPLAAGRSFHGQNQATTQSPASPARQGDNRPPSPSKAQASPAKSSLSKATRFGGKPFDPESEIWSDMDGGPLRFSDDQSQIRNPKSVTFDAAPPQVNEYEMTTPDLSSIASESREGSYEFDEDEIEMSYDRGSSLDRDDSFDASLEDIEKTPVVLPDDWRFMSPASANDELVDGEEDPFVEQPGSPDPEVPPSTTGEMVTRPLRVESLDSNGERRPLPPLPSSNVQQSSHTSTPGKLSAALERASSSQRVLPSPPGPASYSKTDITGLSRPSMTLEDRLRLMMLQDKDQDGHQSEADRQRERRMRRAGARERSGGHEVESRQRKDLDAVHANAPTDDICTPPHISREDILRNIKKSRDVGYDDSDDYSSQLASSPAPIVHDPDIPIPSLEDANGDADTIMKEEQSDDDDIYAIPEYYGSQVHRLDTDGTDTEEGHVNDDDESTYSRNSKEGVNEQRSFSLGSAENQTTPVPINPESNAKEAAALRENNPDSLALPTKEKTESVPENDFAKLDFDLPSFRESLQRPMTPEAQTGDFADNLSTPESVIRHPVENESEDEEPVPEPVATIKAAGTGLKTRPSLTPADAHAMAAARRKVSVQEPTMGSLKESDIQSTELAAEGRFSESAEKTSTDIPAKLTIPDVVKRQSSLVKLDIPLTGTGESLGFGLDKEFDRVIEAQKVAFELALSEKCYPMPSNHTQQNKTQDRHDETLIGKLHTTQSEKPTADQSAVKQRGYLMRQNTKVIIASSRNDEEPRLPLPTTQKDTSDLKQAPSSPRKASQPTWTAEPWNGKIRRQSVKIAGGGVKKKPVPGPVPPLPGMPSNVQDIQHGVDEIESPTVSEHLEDGQDRGRLFVKVVGVKDLDLPLPRGEPLQFSLTLDNGLHCVTTSWLELGKTAPIGQEFELVVQNELEFQLTLQMKVDGTMLKQTRQSAVVSSPAKQKASAFSRVFASPKKRKEMELKQQLMEQQKQRTDAAANSGPWDKLRSLVDRDGSFARAYVSLGDHEKHAYGRPYNVAISCFNEWAVEEPSSLKSKKSSSTSMTQKRPPYKIGNLELQLLYVPKPKGAKDDDMPKSMNACIREMREAESTASRIWEGFLSQQGGDCPYWRRRFFRLQGSKLTAYHEVTRQPRATINLAKAAKLIDDKSVLTQKETSTKGGGRRKSAFSEEEEGYMFVEEGFRIRFANGEVIDFYADSGAEKDGWMKVLSDTVGKGYAAGTGQVKAWTELVFRYERSMDAKRDTAERLLNSNGPPSPRKETAPRTTAKAQAPFQQPPRPRHQHHMSQPEVRSPEARREKTRSLMI